MADIDKMIQSLKRDLLREADRLDELHRNVNKVHVAGKSASAVGSVSALVGIFAAPLTGGASLAITIGSLAGGIASSGASIYQQKAEINAMKTMYGRAKELVDKIDSQPGFGDKYRKLLKSLYSVIKNMKGIYSACHAYFSGEEFASPTPKTVITISKSGNDLSRITATGSEISKVSFLGSGGDAAKVLADATGGEAIKLVEKHTGKVVLNASFEAAGEKNALVTGEVIRKGSQATHKVAKVFGAGLSLVSLGCSVYSTAKAANQLLNNGKSQGGAYLRRLASLLEEFISQK